MRLLAGTHHNICAVGDEDQSIYSWRGADIRNILEFEKDFPEAKIIRLEQNYRSTQNILQGASAVVANNLKRKGKNLWTARQGGSKIGYYEAPDGENEALFAADYHLEISAQGRATRARPRAPPCSTAPTRSRGSIEEAMRRYGSEVPRSRRLLVLRTRRNQGHDFAISKSSMNPEDSIALLRVINTPVRAESARAAWKLWSGSRWRPAFRCGERLRK